MIILILICLILVIVLIINSKSNSKTVNSKPYKSMYPEKKSTMSSNKDLDHIDKQIQNTNKLLDKYKTFEDMIKATMPEGLSEKEEKFFRKWYKKFNFNNIKATEDYIEFVKNWTTSNPMRYRDHLYAFRGHLDTEEWKRSNEYPEFKEDTNLSNARKLTLSSEYLLDEVKLIGTHTKKGEIRTQIKGAYTFLTKSINEFSSPLFNTYKMLIQIIEKHYPEKQNEIEPLLKQIYKNVTDLSSTNKKWLEKKELKYCKVD